VTVVVAVDWGATSIRVGRVDLDARPPTVEVVHRVPHEVTADHRWDWDRLVAETERGIDLALAAGPVASIGVDTWAVDYGLLDDQGRLLSPPHAYRSPRTAGWRDVVDRIGERALYERTGIQLQPFNTIFQLAAHDRDELAAARHALLLADLLVHHLVGGDPAAERTVAGSTALVDLATGDWAPDLLDAAGVPAGLLPPIVEPGTAAGTYRGVPVHRVCAHDTASAVVAMGPEGGPSVGFVASGTWLLVGREQPAPDTSPAAHAANFTNEPGAEGTTRFLKNVAGFWMLEQAKRSWTAPVEPYLMDSVERLVPGLFTPFDATNPELLAPDDMDATVRRLAGIRWSHGPAVVTRAIFESMARTAAEVLGGLGGIERVALVGGGAGSALLAWLLGRDTGLPVDVGSAEAAALGNALVQGIALGRYADVGEARRSLVAGR
jgi:rhamnulokinase